MKFYSFVNKRTKLGFVFFLAMLYFGALFLFLPSFSWAAPLSDSMLGYWKFDGNLDDSGGDGNMGNFYDDTPTDIATFSDIPAGFSFPNLKGINFIESSYFSVSDSSRLISANQLTFSMWARFDTTIPAEGTVLGGNYNEADPSQGFKFLISGSNIYFKVGNAMGAALPLIDIPMGSWFHLAGTWDGSNIKIYLNGTQGGTVYPYNTTLSYGSGCIFKLGSFNGVVDEVRLYNRSLGQIEISDLAAGKHTSATWVGSTQIFEDPGSWNTGAIPDPYTIVNMPQATNYPIAYQPIVVAGIKIGLNSSLDIGAQNLSIKDSGVFDNEGELILQNTGTQVIEGFINDINSGTVIIDGISAATSLKTGTQYYNLKITGTGSISQTGGLTVKDSLALEGGSLNLGGSANINGDLILSTGGLLNTLGGNVLNLKGSWLNNSGIAFNAGIGSTVNLNGVNQSIIGYNNFYNLTKNVSTSDTLYFDADPGSTLDVEGNLSLSGVVGNFLNLRSTNAGTQWSINPSGTMNISYLDVRDSFSGAVLINVIGKNIIDSGNNFNWLFDIDSPIVSINTTATSSVNSFFPVTGYAADPNFVKEVFFSIDSVSNWQSCAANDGTFDSVDEAFICTPSTGLGSGSHTYYIKAIDIYDNETPTYAQWTFMLDNIPPAISTVGATPTTTGATITWTTNENADSRVEYGLDTSYGNSEQDANYAQSHNIVISSLTACTTYHYRIKSKDSLNNLAIGTDQIFTTTGCGSTVDITPPVINDISAIVGNNETTIKWVTDEDATSMIEYGLTTAYGSAIDQSSAGLKQNHSIIIPNLTVCTTYHYSIRSRDNSSNLNYSADQSFTTGGCTNTSTVSSCTKDAPGEPEITSIQVEDKNSVILKIDEASGEVDEYEVKYGKSAENYEWEIDEIDEDDIESYTIDELSPDTTYYFKVRAVNECEKGNWSDVESTKTEKEEVLTNYLADITPALTTPNTSLVENIIEPMVEVTSTEDNGSTSENSPYLSSDEEINEDDDKDEEFEDAKESKAPVIEECGSTSVEMLDSLGRKKLKLEGFGPPNTALTVYVYSDDPIVLSVKTDINGDWSYVLEDNLKDGEHQVYVAITEEGGRIKGKSNPLVFVKTAQAVSVVSGQAISPTQKAKNNFILLSIVVSLVGLFLALATIGWKMKVSKKSKGLEIV